MMYYVMETYSDAMPDVVDICRTEEEALDIARKAAKEDNKTYIVTATAFEIHVKTEIHVYQHTPMPLPRTRG